MTAKRHRVRCSVNERPVEVWDGASVVEVLEAAAPGSIREVLAGRVKVVDAGGRSVDLESSVTDGAALTTIPLPHPGSKPI